MSLGGGFGMGVAGGQSIPLPDPYPRIRGSEFLPSNLPTPLSVGQPVAAVQQPGAHIGTRTMPDIAVGVSTPRGWNLVPCFDAMTDDLFANCRYRGVSSRSDLIISKEARDADASRAGGDVPDDGNPGELAPAQVTRPSPLR